MPDYIARDAALEKEAAVEEAKKALNEEWEVKMRESLHEYANYALRTKNAAIKEKDEQIKSMKETMREAMREAMEEERGHGAGENNKIVLHMEKTHKASLQEALAAERKKLTDEHNADRGKALEVSTKEMEERHRYALSQMGEDTHSAEIAELKKQLRDKDLAHEKAQEKIFDWMGRVVEAKAEEERDGLKAAKQALAHTEAALLEAKIATEHQRDLLNDAKAKLTQTEAQRDAAQEEVKSLATSLNKTRKELDSCKATMAHLDTAAQQCETTDADTKTLQFHDVTKMEALLNAEKIKAEANKVLATLQETADIETVLAAENELLQVSLNSYKANMLEMSQQLSGLLEEEMAGASDKVGELEAEKARLSALNNELEQSKAFQIKELEQSNASKLKELEQSNASKIKELEESKASKIKELEGELEEALELGALKVKEVSAQVEALKDKLNEKMTKHTAVFAGAEEAMTLMNEYQDWQEATQRQLEEAQGDLRRMSDHALDMEAQQTQAKSLFKQMKEEKKQLEVQVALMDVLTEEKQIAEAKAKKSAAALALALADNKILQLTG